MNPKIVRNIAHDLKGPVGNTLMYSDLLREQLKILSKKEDVSGNDFSDLKDLADNIYSINEKLITLIDSWSEIYKILLGDIEPKIKKLKVEQFVEELREKNELYFTKKNINCTWSIPEDCTLRTDYDLLMRILDNLLTVSITNVDYDSEIEVCIEDSGESESGVKFILINQVPDDIELYAHYLEDWTLEKFREEKLMDSVIKASGVGLVYGAVAVDALGGKKGITKKEDGTAEVWFTLPAG